jgi:hypothetical protein
VNRTIKNELCFRTSLERTCYHLKNGLLKWVLLHSCVCGAYSIIHNDSPMDNLPSVRPLTKGPMDRFLSWVYPLCPLGNPHAHNANHENHYIKEPQRYQGILPFLRILAHPTTRLAQIPHRQYRGHNYLSQSIP